MSSPGSIAERLRSHTTTLVGGFMKRLSGFRGHPEFRSMIRMVDDDSDTSLIRMIRNSPYSGSHDGKRGYLAVGIDGSMDHDERLEMLLFYVCVSAFRCPITVDSNTAMLHVDVREARHDSSLSLSSAVPLWLEDLSYVSGVPDLTETDLEFKRKLESIPFALMTLGELSIALDSMERRDQDDGHVKVVFLDRPLSGTFSTSSKDLRLLLRMGRSSLTTIQTSHGMLSMLDINLASILGPGNLYIPRRGPYLVYAAIQMMLRDGCETSLEELRERLGLDDKGRDRVVKGLCRLDERYDGQLIERHDGASIRLRDDVRDYWERIMAGVRVVRNRVFGSTEHPLQLGDEWLTVLDINAVNTFLIYELFNRSINGDVLVLGITKDTSATDFTRSIIPLATLRGMLGGSSPQFPEMSNDRAFLTVMAAMNSETIKTPWRSISYDVSFTTMMGGIDDQVLSFKAARKHVFRERLFIKSYFQLRTFATDSAVRSPVFVYDRFYNPSTDVPCEQLYVLERVRGKPARVKIEPYFEGKHINPLDNLILHILSLSDNIEVLEAAGHNQLLYLADKAAKTEVRLMRNTLRKLVDFELDALARNERIFHISRRFRDIRAESERARSSNSNRKGYMQDA